MRAASSVLIDVGSAVNARDSLGMTALMYAADFGRPGVIALLFGAGADRAARNHKGETALMLAVKRVTTARLRRLRLRRTQRFRANEPTTRGAA